MILNACSAEARRPAWAGPFVANGWIQTGRPRRRTTGPRAVTKSFYRRATPQAFCAVPGRMLFTTVLPGRRRYRALGSRARPALRCAYGVPARPAQSLTRGAKRRSQEELSSRTVAALFRNPPRQQCAIRSPARRTPALLNTAPLSSRVQTTLPASLRQNPRPYRERCRVVAGTVIEEQPAAGTGPRIRHVTAGHLQRATLVCLNSRRTARDVRRTRAPAACRRANRAGTPFDRKPRARWLAGSRAGASSPFGAAVARLDQATNLLLSQPVVGPWNSLIRHES